MMANELQTKLDAILEDKNTNLLPEHLKAGVTCLGIEGTMQAGVNTSDATATAADIAIGETAYVNGEKIEGTVNTIESGSMTTINSIINNTVETEAEYEQVIIKTTAQAPTLLREGAELHAMATYENTATAIGLSADKITKGTTILGIEGTAEVGESTEVPVKLFKTTEEMHEDTTIKLDDMACVYGTYFENWTVTTMEASATFPATVVLSTAITDSLSATIRSADDNGWFDGNISLSSTEMTMYFYGDNSDGEITYTSADGITYTRTDTLSETIDFGTKIYFMMTEEWNDAFGYFMQILRYNFGGLHSGQEVLHNTMIYNFRLENDELVYDTREYDRDYYMNILKVEQTMSGSATIMPKIVDGEIVGYFSSGYAGSCIVKFNNKLYYGYGPTTVTWSESYLQYYPLNGTYNSYPADQLTQLTMDEGTLYLIPESEMADDENALYFTVASSANSSGTVKYITDTTYKSVTFYKTQGNTYIEYVPVPTQLNATTSEIMSGKIAYTSDGVITGTLGESISSGFNDDAGKVYAMTQFYYDSLPTVELSSDDSEFAYYPSDITCIPLRSDGSHIFDISKATRLNWCIQQCQNLHTIVGIDTSNITTAGMMFYVYTKNSLVNIPVMDFGKVTSMDGMVTDCVNLSDASLNNLMATMLTATSYTGTKTLAMLGVTESQAARCQTLSNYEAFVAAGWTTGY